jgi:hypothetical protein
VQQARVEMGAWIQGQLAGVEVTLTLPLSSKQKSVNLFALELLKHRPY